MQNCSFKNRQNDPSTRSVQSYLPTTFDLAAVLNRSFHGLLEHFNGSFGVHGPNQRLLVERVADPAPLQDLLVRLDEVAQETVVDVRVQDETAGGSAALAGGAHASEEGRTYGHGQVSVLVDDDGVVAPELENLLPETGSDVLGNL